ncbi:thiamine biosynthesis lipoprotein [Microbacterium sp. SLBN-154]|uniref:FAD:protein FMN transferase n=1 Tax=Microbacterium sp. SLBN-154 TaxID=2768458 RepID=UPI0011501123|nr:FAD:protein FMN transferase [Microbacterium sp. SLBN-154]TQK20041.1 thiamine biosynthesis lipoprotein [Microbacterium sp. SLBN-154]
MSSPSAPGATTEIWRFEAIGTRWEVGTAHALTAADRAAVAVAIESFDRAWSRFRDDSVVTVLADRGGAVPAPTDTDLLLSRLTEIADATGDAVNPLVGGVLSRRGYDAQLTLNDRGAEPAPAWRDVLSWTSDALSLSRPATIDVGALGKGRLVDIVHGVLTERVAGPLVVDASGDLRVSGADLRVALEHPYDSTRAIGVVTVSGGAVCASAVNRRRWGQGLHHVLDARTGQPVRTIAATWTFAPDALTADAIATALFFDGGSEIAHRWGVEWVRMTTDGRVEWSPGNPADLFRRADTVAS